VTSSTKLEVHSYITVSSDKDLATAIKVTCTENLVKFRHDVFDICERTEDGHCNTSHTYTGEGGEVKIRNNMF